MSLSERIKDQAIKIGFHKAGISAAAALGEEGKDLREWLARKYHASMAWMERNAEKRVDPARILPGVRSVVSVALNYYVSVAHVDEGDRGRISRYAWGDDYHGIVKGKLEDLAQFIRESCPGAAALAYVDTGPVMEKVWAARAGIGWQGKHTNVITREYGSWVFLGEVLTDLELQPDAPAEDHCGTCTACLDACPTGAIVEPYKLDAGRCISYQTIENKGALAGEVAARLEGWVFGCDICQDVCPWNRFQQETSEVRFRPRPWNLGPGLRELTGLTAEEFKRRFDGGPVMRARLEGLVRNAKAAENAAAGTRGGGG